jgi:hypothetical protein
MSKPKSKLGAKGARGPGNLVGGKPKGPKGGKGKKGGYPPKSGGSVVVVLDSYTAKNLFLALAQALGAPIDNKKGKKGGKGKKGKKGSDATPKGSKPKGGAAGGGGK